MPRPKKTAANVTVTNGSPPRGKRTKPLSAEDRIMVREVRRRGQCPCCYKKKIRCEHVREEIRREMAAAAAQNLSYPTSPSSDIEYYQPHAASLHNGINQPPLNGYHGGQPIHGIVVNGAQHQQFYHPNSGINVIGYQNSPNAGNAAPNGVVPRPLAWAGSTPATHHRSVGQPPLHEDARYMERYRTLQPKVIGLVQAIENQSQVAQQPANPSDAYPTPESSPSPQAGTPPYSPLSQNDRLSFLGAPPFPHMEMEPNIVSSSPPSSPFANDTCDPIYGDRPKTPTGMTYTQLLNSGMECLVPSWGMDGVSLPSESSSSSVTDNDHGGDDENDENGNDNEEDEGSEEDEDDEEGEVEEDEDSSEMNGIEYELCPQNYSSEQYYTPED